VAPNCGAGQERLAKGTQERDLERRNVMWISSWLRNRNRSAANSRTRRLIRQRASVLGRLEVLEDRSMLSFGSPISVSLGGTPPIALATGDVNGDGRADIVAAVSQGIEVMLGKGNGHFAKPAFYPVYNTEHVTAVAVADINGDGKLDIITGNDPPPDGGAFGQTASISVLQGNGTGSFSASQTYNNALPESSGPSSLALADFDGDGKLDIAASSGGGGELDVLFNGASWTRGSSYTLPSIAGGSPSTVAAGDFNGDGKPDLVVADGANVLSVLLNAGNGSFAAQYVNYGVAATDLAVGDFNGDGKLDIVTNNRNSNGGIGMLEGKGDGTFSVAYLYGESINAIAVGDFNKDGKLDIVTLGAEMDVLLGTGNGTFGTFETAQEVGPAGSNVLVADLNNDGFPDLVQIDSTGGSIDVLLNNADWHPKGHK
jgi:hypothetical protein